MVKNTHHLHQAKKKSLINFNFYITIICILLIFGYTFSYHKSQDQVQATIQKTERVCDSDQNCRYLVFTKSEVFENTDSVIFLKFNSSDFHANLEPNKTYELNVAGWRNPFFSMYRNILSYKEIE